MELVYCNNIWSDRIQNNGFEIGVKWYKLMKLRAKDYIHLHPYRIVYIFHRIYKDNDDNYYADFYNLYGESRWEYETLPESHKLNGHFFHGEKLTGSIKEEIKDYYITKGYKRPILINKLGKKNNYVAFEWFD